MRRYLLSVPALVVAALMLAQPVAAQEKEKEEKTEKKEQKELKELKEQKELKEKAEKDKSDKKVTINEEIVIKRKTDKDEKVVIEIKGDEITVNGKPIEDFDDDDIVVRKRKTTGATVYSPFRGQGGTLSFGDNQNFFKESTVPFLGVVTEKDDKGAKIEEITEGSAADKAGLKEGDVITRIGDDKIEDPDDLTKAVRKHKPDEQVSIGYERNGKSEKTNAKLGSRNALNYVAPRIKVTPDMNFNWDGHNNWTPGSGRARLGIKAQDTEDGKGVKVVDVDEESAAEKAGVKEGDIITEFDGKKVDGADELAKFAREAQVTKKTVIKITVNRDGKTQTLEVKTPRKLKTADL